jgi:hypothetical protein
MIATGSLEFEPPQSGSLRYEGLSKAPTLSPNSVAPEWTTGASHQLNTGAEPAGRRVHSSPSIASGGTGLSLDPPAKSPGLPAFKPSELG